MKGAHYLAERLKKETDVVFGITGGAIVNVLDACHKKKLKNIMMHNEQGCAMAADAYARVSGKLGIAIATSGPGATNLITGTCCSWFDSVSVLTIAGQVPTSQLKRTGVRQLGFQETDTQSLFKPITKLSARVTHLQRDLEIAIYLAKEGRKGPTFLEVCDDIQRNDIDVDEVFIRSPKEKPVSKRKIKKLITEIKKAKRPLLILGAGARCAIPLVDKLNIPTLLTWGAMDFLPDDHRLNCRDFGVTAQRIGNIAIEASDLIICLGTRLDSHNVVGGWAKDVKKIMVDLDKAELDKHEAFLKFNCDAKQVVTELMKDDVRADVDKWTENIQKLRKKYPLSNKIIYKFMKKLSEASSEGDIIIAGAGQTLVWCMQSWKVKKNQRLFSAFNHSPMGYAVPASIGAQVASPKSTVIAVVGDGALQMNLQELQTIIGYNFPIKIFVVDNNGYGMIKQTQADWKELDNRVSCEPYMTDLKVLSTALGFDYFEMNEIKDMDIIETVLQSSKPTIIKLKVPDGAKIIPKLKLGDAFDDLTPKLTKKKRKKIDEILATS